VWHPDRNEEEDKCHMRRRIHVISYEEEDTIRRRIHVKTKKEQCGILTEVLKRQCSGVCTKCD
jgi:hypothetical protein